MLQLQEIIYKPIYADKPEELRRVTVNPAIWGRFEVEHPGAGERFWLFTDGKFHDITDMLTGNHPKFALVEVAAPS